MALYLVSPNPRYSGAILENSNGNIYAADHPIYSVFGSRMGFSGLADRMALFTVRPNSIGMWGKTMREEYGHNLKYFLSILVNTSFSVFSSPAIID